MLRLRLRPVLINPLKINTSQFDVSQRLGDSIDLKCISGIGIGFSRN